MCIGLNVHQTCTVQTGFEKERGEDGKKGNGTSLDGMLIRRFFFDTWQERANHPRDRP